MRRAWIADLSVAAVFQAILFYVMFILSWGVAENCSVERMAACQQRANRLFLGVYAMGLVASAGFVAGRKLGLSTPQRLVGLLSSGLLCCVLLSVAFG